MWSITGDVCHLTADPLWGGKGAKWSLISYSRDTQQLLHVSASHNFHCDHEIQLGQERRENSVTVMDWSLDFVLLILSTALLWKCVELQQNVMEWTESNMWTEQTQSLLTQLHTVCVRNTISILSRVKLCDVDRRPVWFFSSSWPGAAMTRGWRGKLSKWRD